MSLTSDRKKKLILATLFFVLLITSIYSGFSGVDISSFSIESENFLDSSLQERSFNGVKDKTDKHSQKTNVVENFPPTIVSNLTETFIEETDIRESMIYNFAADARTEVNVSLSNATCEVFDVINGLENWVVNSTTQQTWNTLGVVREPSENTSSQYPVEFYASGEGQGHFVKFDVLNASSIDVPNLYYNPTAIGFKMKFADASSDFLATFHSIELKILFSDGINEGWFTFLLSYHQNFAPVGIIEDPEVNLTIADPPDNIATFVINSGLTGDWKEVEINVTRILQDYFDPASYPYVKSMFSNIKSIDLRFEGFNKDYNATLLLDDIHLSSTIQNAGSDLLMVNDNYLNSSDTSFTFVGDYNALNITINPGMFPFISGNVIISAILERSVDFSLTKESINNSVYQVMLSTTAEPLVNVSESFYYTFIVPNYWYLQLSSNFSFYSTELTNDTMFSVFHINSTEFLTEIIVLVPNGILDIDITRLDVMGFLTVKGTCQQASGDLFLHVNSTLVASTSPVINKSFYFFDVQLTPDLLTGTFELKVIWTDGWLFGEFLLLVDPHLYVPSYSLVVELPQKVYKFEDYSVRLAILDGGNPLNNFSVYYAGDFGRGAFSEKESWYMANITNDLFNNSGELFIDIVSPDYQVIKRSYIIDIIDGQVEFSLSESYSESVLSLNTPVSIKTTSSITYDDYTVKNMTKGTVVALIGDNMINEVEVNAEGTGWIHFIPINVVDNATTELLLVCNYYFNSFLLTTTNKSFNLTVETELTDEFTEISLIPDKRSTIYTNGTFEVDFLINYTVAGSNWLTSLPFSYNDISSVFIERGGVLLPVSINGTHVFWNRERQPNDSEFLVFAVKSPNLFSTKDLDRADPPSLTISFILQLSSSLENIIAKIPLTPEESTGTEWTVYDFRNVDVTSMYDIWVIDSMLFISSFSGVQDSVISMTIRSVLQPLAFESLPLIPDTAEASEGSVEIIGKLVSWFPVFASVNVESSEPVIALPLMVFQESITSWTYRGQISDFDWNETLVLSVTVEDILGNTIESPSQTIQVVDTVVPELSIEFWIDEGQNHFQAIGRDSGSGIKNITLDLHLNGEPQMYYTNSSEFLFSLPVDGVEEFMYSFEVFDNAGNSKKTETRTLVFPEPETTSNGIIQLINTTLLTVTLLLGGVISINRIVRRKRILEDV
jgi:hypothetical protein